MVDRSVAFARIQNMMARMPTSELVTMAETLRSWEEGIDSDTNDDGPKVVVASHL